MEANAPERLYLIQHNGLISYCRNNDEDIEYIRTDAFIEKACNWLRENIHNRVYKCGDDLGFPTAEFLKEFKVYMKE